jgi:hypothetical protein
MRQLSRALRRLQGTTFEVDPQQVDHDGTTAKVPIIWLIKVLDALGEFVHRDEWMK